MNNLWRALALVAAFATGFQPVHAQAPAPLGQARFAFVIGNDDYEDGALPTAANDASLVADAYKTAGFEVTGARNLDQETLRSAYREFLEKVAAAGPESVAAVYVSGYGVQSEGENYFIPPGARVQRESDLALNAVRISDLTRALSGLPSRGRIVALDIAYAPPFAKSWPSLAPGLALIEPEPDTLIAFNAAPGAIAPVAQPPYGPYAQALAEMLREPGLPIDEVFASVRARVAELTKGAQAPWSESRLSKDIVMLERGPDAPPPAFPEQRMEARRAQAIAQMSAQDAYAAALDRDNIAAYEEFLASFGDSPYADNVRSMLATRREARTWRSTLNVNTPNAYWSYLKRYPKGPHATEARRRLARLSVEQEPPQSFAAIDYPFAPPPPEEIIFFEDPRPRYFIVHEAPIVIYAPPPRWWSPPPPPVYVEENYFFLPAPVNVVEQPVWLAPPRYVAPPQPPVWLDERRSLTPYVAIPAALAAGIVAGKIIHDRRDGRRQEGRDGRRDAAIAPRQFMPPVARSVRPVAISPLRDSGAIAPRQALQPAPATAPAIAPAIAPNARTLAPAVAPLPRTGAQQDAPTQRGPQRAQQLRDERQQQLQQQGQTAPGSRFAPTRQPEAPPAASAGQRRLEEMQRRRAQEETRRGQEEARPGETRRGEGDRYDLRQQRRVQQEQMQQRLRERSTAPDQRQQVAPETRRQEILQQRQQQMQQQRQQEGQRQQQDQRQQQMLQQRQQQQQEQRQQQMLQQRQQQQQEGQRQQQQEQRQQQMLQQRQQEGQRQQQIQQQQRQQMQQQRQQQQEQRKPDRSRRNDCGGPNQPPCR